MKNRYLKSLTARVTILMLSFLCLAGSQGAGAQIPMERRNSSSTSVVSSQKPVMPRMTKSGGNAVSVNGTEYDTWANAVAATNMVFCNLVIFSGYSFACIIIFCNFAERN